MLYYLFRHYAQTKFHSILKGSRFFCVDLTWNDPDLYFQALETDLTAFKIVPEIIHVVGTYTKYSLTVTEC